MLKTMNLDSGDVSASLSLSHTSCHFCDIHSTSHDEEDGDVEDEVEGGDEDEEIQLLRNKRIARPPLLTLH